MRREKFHVVCTTIRRKIRGEANDALVASNVNINWLLIKKTLLTYYGEKRDLGTLDYQLMSCQQRGRSLEEYYDDVNRLLSLIANQIKTDEKLSHPEAAKALIEVYNEKAIDAFVRGLDGHIGLFLKNYKPESLAMAYSYCISFQNTEFRKHLTKPKTPEAFQGPRNLIPLVPPRLPPRIPPKPNIHTPNQRMHNHHYQQNFNYKSNYQHNKKPEIINYRYGHGIPITLQYQSPPYPKPQVQQRNPFISADKPEPMEVDPSIRTRQVNYGNRPQASNFQQPQPPLKRPRMFAMMNEDDGSIPIEPDSAIEGVHKDYDEEQQESFERYMQLYDKQEGDDEPVADNAEFNFLG